MTSCRRKCHARANESARVLCYLLLIAPAETVTACAVNPVTGKDELMLVSEEEIKIGKSVYRDALWSAEGGGRRVP